MKSFSFTIPVLNNDEAKNPDLVNQYKFESAEGNFISTKLLNFTKKENFEIDIPIAIIKEFENLDQLEKLLRDSNLLKDI